MQGNGFIVTFNKPYVWFTESPEQKVEFLITLVKVRTVFKMLFKQEAHLYLIQLCQRYLKKQPKTININEEMLASVDLDSYLESTDKEIRAHKTLFSGQLEASGEHESGMYLRKAAI